MLAEPYFSTESSLLFTKFNPLSIAGAQEFLLYLPSTAGQ
jgi:hypothetical protein